MGLYRTRGGVVEDCVCNGGGQAIGAEGIECETPASCYHIYLTANAHNSQVDINQ